MIEWIEFAGMPGCGKSTLCNAILQQNDICNGSIITLYMIERWISTPLRNQIVITLLKLLPQNWKYAICVKRYAARYRDVSSRAVSLLLALYGIPQLLCWFTKRKRVFLEEGIIQNLTSIPHLQELKSDQDLVSILSLFKKRYRLKVIYCEAAEKEVIKRLRKRNGKDRFNAISDDELLLDALRKKKGNLEIILSTFNDASRVNMDCPINETINQAYEMCK